MCYKHGNTLKLGDNLLRGKGLDFWEFLVIQLVLISLKCQLVGIKLMLTSVGLSS